MTRIFLGAGTLRQAGADAASWAVAIGIAAVLRFEFDLTAVDWSGAATVALLAAALQLVIGSGVGLYAGRWRFGSFEEVVHVVRAVAITAVLLAFLDRFFLDHLVPVSATLGGGVMALILMAGTRYSWRLVNEKNRRPSPDEAKRVVVFGAGEAGAQIVTAMLRDPRSPYFPVALVDDDPSRRNLSIKGVKVEGTLEDLEHVSRRHRAGSVLIAIPSADSEVVRRANEAATRAGLEASILPSVGELVDGSVKPTDIRKVDERDLLGRHQIDLNVEAIADFLTGRRVLVTGAGGSIGSELCRQINRFDPASLVMLDTDESNLHRTELSMHGRALLDSPHLVIASIRDAERIHEVFATHRPEVVFHAAALKHLPLLELHPAEAVKTNVIGTLNVLEAARSAGVDTFVNISTDKAADPTSTLGYTKRIAERLTAHFDGEAAGSYLSVRFGNVLGSRGSVIDAFKKQIALGGPVTVTHPDVKRYFMTVEEAVQLVIQAGALDSNREVLVLDMGKPVLISDVAKRMIEHSHRPIDIEFTGLRPGEKLEEVLFSADEAPERRHHPLILHVAVDPLEPAALGGLVELKPAEMRAEFATFARPEAPRVLLGDTLTNG